MGATFVLLQPLTQYYAQQALLVAEHRAPQQAQGRVRIVFTGFRLGEVGETVGPVQVQRHAQVGEVGADGGLVLFQLLPVLAVIVVWAVRRNARSTAARLAGHSVIRFGPDAMQVETGAGGRVDVPYRGLTGPYRTAHGIFLYDPAANVARVFPRAALTPESEAALWALLCRKTGREV